MAGELDDSLIVLRGHPGYYPRFGFRTATELGVNYPLPDGSDPKAAMALPLPGYSPVSAPKGKVIEPDYFKAAEH